MAADTIEQLGGVYEDVELLVFEGMCGTPNRFVMRTRALFLAPLAAKARPKRWEKFGENALARLRKNEPAYRDMAAERWLSDS